MGTIPTWIVIILGLTGVGLFAFTVIMWIAQDRYSYTTRYEDLKSFLYWIENCPANEHNRATALDRIKTERARDEMEVPEYLNLVNDITFVYVKKWAALIGQRGDKNNII